MLFNSSWMTRTILSEAPKGDSGRQLMSSERQFPKIINKINDKQSPIDPHMLFNPSRKSRAVHSDSPKDDPAHELIPSRRQSIVSEQAGKRIGPLGVAIVNSYWSVCHSYATSPLMPQIFTLKSAGVPLRYHTGLVTSPTIRLFYECLSKFLVLGTINTSLIRSPLFTARYRTAE